VHRNAQLILDKRGRQYFKPGLSVLEVGPDGTPSTFQKMVGGETERWDTLDIATKYVQPTWLVTDSYKFPVPDNSYDIVLSGQVIEHVPKIWRWFPELARMCKPGGLVITINPVSWHYHEAPIDCWRIYPEGMKALAEDAGLDVISSDWESVEFDRIPFLPKRIRQEKRFLMLLFGPCWAINRVLKFPFQGSFDTITIARKPLTFQPNQTESVDYKRSGRT
jgi:SAM-dependent methyltransferase